MGLLSWIYAPGEQERGDKLDAQLAQLNADAKASGKWTQAQFDKAEADRLQSAGINVDSELNQAFAEGAAEGLKAEQDWFKGTLNKIGLGALGFIPWWVFVGVAIYAAWRLGLLKALTGKIAK